MASAADVKLQPLKRFDNDLVKGINNVVKENNITDLVIGLEAGKGFSPSFVYNLYNGYLQNNEINVLLYHAAQPISTVKKYAVIVADKAYKEAGFFHALLRIWNIARNSGAVMTFYAPENIVKILQKINQKANIEAEFIIMNNWNDGEKIARKLEENEGLIAIMAKQGMVSYNPRMRFLPDFLNTSLMKSNYLLIFPFSEYDTTETEKRSFHSHGDFTEISTIIGKIFK